MDSFFASLQKFGIGRLTAILGAAAGAAAVMAAIILHVSAQPQALLYSNLDLKEAGEITTNLDQANIKYTAKGDGSTIMVDRDQVATARMMLAGKGLPTAASVGYEIFDKAPTLGQTEFVQNLDNQRALEGELARTINTLKGVSSTRVHLVMPKRELFSDSAQQSKATVVLGLSSGNPNAEQVASIRNLVASAVPNLKASDVTIVDDRNHLLAAGGDESANGLGSAHRDEVEDTLRKRITDIVEGVVGPGAARVTVTADLDQTMTTKEQVEYNPDGQVVRSLRTDEGAEQTADPNSAGATTASANIPNGTQQAPSLSTASNSSKQTSEVTNYEISTTKTTSVTSPGEIRKLAVAVVVDGTLTPSKDGKAPPAYAARSPEDMQKIEDLVRAAVGITDARGDQIKVTNIRFNHGELDNGAGTEAKGSLFDFDKNDIMRAAEVGVLFIVALLTLFLVARPLLKFITTAPTNYITTGPGGVLTGPGGTVLAGAGGMPGVSGPADGGFPQITGGGGSLSPVTTDASGIDIARIEGQVKASSVKKVSEFVDRHPEESVSILRSWLHDS